MPNYYDLYSDYVQSGNLQPHNPYDNTGSGNNPTNQRGGNNPAPNYNQFYTDAEANVAPVNYGMSVTDGLSYAKTASDVYKNLGGKAIPLGKALKHISGPGTGMFANSSTFSTSTAAGKYGNAMLGQSGPQAAMNNALPTYIAGRIIKGIADDKDPTTMNVGETVGAGVSGWGAGAAIGTAILPGVGTVAGGIAGALISLLGGKKKRDKAREAAREQEVESGEEGWRTRYEEAQEEWRDREVKEANARAHSMRSSQFSNSYGMGAMQDPYGIYSESGFRYDEGGKHGDHDNVEIQDVSMPIDSMYNRQLFKESEFKSGAVSPAGAKTIAQITPNTFSDGLKKGYVPKGTTLDDLVKDPHLAIQFQRAYMKDLHNRSWNKGNEQSKRAKALGAYNAGPTRMVEILNAMKKDGINTYDNVDWVDKIPEYQRDKKTGDPIIETSDYIKKILLGSNPKFEKKYSIAWEKVGKNYSDGGQKKGKSEFTGQEAVVEKKADQDRIEEAIAEGNYKKAGKIVKKAKVTPGDANHQSNALPVGDDGTVYDKYGNPLSIRIQDGGGVYDHAGKFDVSDEAAGRLAAQDIEKWKSNGMA